MYHQQIFCIMKICHLEDQLCKLEKEVIVTRILEVLQIWFLSTLKFYHLRLPFVSAFEDNFFKLKVVQLERHMVLTYIRDYIMPYFIKCVGYKKTPLTSTSGFSPDSVCIFWIIVSNWAIREYPRTKPDWQGVKGLLLIN